MSGEGKDVSSATLVWFRRDLRLSDHSALTAACERGPVIPVFIHDQSVASLGAAPKWRLGLALEQLAKSLAATGSQLILRRGNAADVLQELIAETGAKAVFWSRLYECGQSLGISDVLFFEFFLITLQKQ